MSADSGVDRYLDRRDKGVRKEIITPEGVPLGFTLAGAGDRAGAFLLDIVFVYGAIFAIVLLVVMAGDGEMSDSSWAMPFITVMVFFLQNFYFIFFELRWQGQTPGKKIIGLRVIDGHGGVMDASAIVARNLMRDIEVFIPAQVIFFPEHIWPSAPKGAIALASIWVFGLMLMPLFNKDKLRIGDMVGGTLVVLAPKALLLPDIGGQEAARAQRDQPLYSFTPAQLDIYGEYELQVLEGVLRVDELKVLERLQSFQVVCEQIKRKIEWDPQSWLVDDELFLKAFYTALRSHLERKMLFGKRRKDKYGG